MKSLIQQLVLDKRSLTSKRFSRSLIFITIGVMVLFLIYLFISSTNTSKEVKFIQNQVIESYEDSPLGKALNEFFSHPEWSLIEENTVMFSGEAYWGDDKAQFNLKFIVDLEHKRFDIISYSINDKRQSFNQFLQLLDTIYNR
ncbi:MAG: hypothetical protein K2G70_03830 [Turicibacter sp.]|nr:hypothetical protein [Turicibacter sp.]